jgi:tetratricopeptide (TPR) repeat protein
LGQKNLFNIKQNDINIYKTFLFYNSFILQKEIFMKIIPIIFTLIFIYSIAWAGANDAISIRDNIEKNYFSFDKNKLEKIYAELDSLREVNKDSLNVLKYYSAMLHINLGKIYYNIDSDIAYDHFDDAISDIEDINNYDQDAEYLALVSCSYGKKSALSSLRAFFFGISAKNTIIDANDVDSNNTCVMLIAATHLMHTPATFGGDKARARELLMRAMELNAEKATDSSSTRVIWAKDAEIYAYLAQLAILEENKEEALDFMNKALELEPDYGFVKIDLQKQFDELKKQLDELED